MPRTIEEPSNNSWSCHDPEKNLKRRMTMQSCCSSVYPIDCPEGRWSATHCSQWVHNQGNHARVELFPKQEGLDGVEIPAEKFWFVFPASAGGSEARGAGIWHCPHLWQLTGTWLEHPRGWCCEHPLPHLWGAPLTPQSLDEGWEGRQSERLWC